MAFDMSFARCLGFIITFAYPLDFLQAQVPSAAPSLDDPTIEQRITKLISEMTLEGEIGQLVHYADSSTGPGAPHPDYREQVAAAKQADVVLMAMGENAEWMTGEAASRAHLGLPGNQEQLLEAVAATGKPVVLIVFSGRPLALDWAADHVSAILQAWFPEVQAGRRCLGPFGRNVGCVHNRKKFGNACR